MKNFYCTIHPNDNVVCIFREDIQIGYVTVNDSNEPYLQFFYGVNQYARLTFSEIEIIMDNWNQLRESKKDK